MITRGSRDHRSELLRARYSVMMPSGSHWSIESYLGALELLAEAIADMKEAS
jgi:hypothetical protein